MVHSNSIKDSPYSTRDIQSRWSVTSTWCSLVFDMWHMSFLVPSAICFKIESYLLSSLAALKGGFLERDRLVQASVTFLCIGI